MAAVHSIKYPFLYSLCPADVKNVENICYMIFYAAEKVHINYLECLDTEKAKILSFVSKWPLLDQNYKQIQIQ